MTISASCANICHRSHEPLLNPTHLGAFYDSLGQIAETFGSYNGTQMLGNVIQIFIWNECFR